MAETTLEIGSREWFRQFVGVDRENILGLLAGMERRNLELARERDALDHQLDVMTARYDQGCVQIARVTRERDAAVAAVEAARRHYHDTALYDAIAAYDAACPDRRRR